MSSFSKDDLSFVQALPEHVEIECPLCLHIMLSSPSQVNCCGHRFCSPCIERVRDENGPCPMCKENDFQTMIDKERVRIINGLQVYCTNKSKSNLTSKKTYLPTLKNLDCQWKGDLKNLSAHLSKGKREGECQFEEVKCRYEKCKEKKQRCHLDDHEKNYCPHRPQCQYCNFKGYISITDEHYDKCLQYPMPCPNMCQPDMKLPRSSVDFHLSKECPLQPVECPLSWAGCTHKPLRKDSQSHTTDPDHISLLAVACGQLKKVDDKLVATCEQFNVECSQLKKDNEKLTETCGQLKKVCNQLKKENDELKKQMQMVTKVVGSDNNPLLPITVTVDSPSTHAYTHKFGHHISVKYVRSYDGGNTVYFAFHDGKFDEFKPKMPKISVQYEDTLVPLLTDTEAVYEKTAENQLDQMMSQLRRMYVAVAEPTIDEPKVLKVILRPNEVHNPRSRHVRRRPQPKAPEEVQILINWD